MKNYLILLLSFFLTIPALSQNQLNNAFYIYRNDGVINAFFYSEVDSIVCSTIDTDSVIYNDFVTQEIWTEDSIYRIPIVAIDSISFIKPPTIYKKDVTRMEANLLNYIIGAEGQTLKLKSDIPTELIPVGGDKLVLLEGCDILPYGFSGIVSSINIGSSSIDVVCEQAYLEDFFDSFCSVSTFYGVTTDVEDTTLVFTDNSRRRITYRPNDVVFSLGTFKVDHSYEVSQGIAFDDDLALSGGTSYSVEIHPTFKIHTFLILGEGHGTYFSYRITGDLQVTSQSSLYGGLSYDHDFDGLIVSCPIPATGNLVKFYINPGLFVRANATISSSIKSTQNYTFGSAFDFSSNGDNVIKPSIGGRLASSSIEMIGSLDGSIAGGAYIETGFNLLSRDIAKVCVRGEMGARLSGSFVLHNSDIDNALKETKLYERLKASEVELGSFVDVSLQTSVAHTGNGDTLTVVGKEDDVDRFANKIVLTWELSEPIHRWNIVPEFSNTKLVQTSGSKTSVDAYTELSGDCLFPVGVGYKLLDVYEHEVANYDAQINYINRPSKMKHTFVGIDEDKLYEYKVYPKIKLFSFDVLASPCASIEKMPVAITGDCSNVTKNSTIVSCTYENVPKDGICGVEYIWYGGTKKQTGRNNNGTQSITLSDLEPGTNYTYHAYIETNEEIYYGETKTFKTKEKEESNPELTPVAITGNYSNVTKNSAIVSCTYENVPENSVCGVEYTSSSDGSGKIYVGSSNGTHSIILSHLQPGTSYTYCAYIEDANGQIYYGETKTFKTEEKEDLIPIAITGNYSNVTKNSATVSCTYENVPEGGVCRVEYTSNGGGSGKIYVGSSNGTHSIILNYLQPETSYTYRAYIETDGQTYYGEDKSFTTDQEDPQTTYSGCPDENHPHWIDLGLPSGTLWSCCNIGASSPEEIGTYYTFEQIESGQVPNVPSKEQIEELIEYTDNITTRWMGVKGIEFVDTAGDGSIMWDDSCIFIPGGTSYWSSTIFYYDNAGDTLHDIYYLGLGGSNEPFVGYTPFVSCDSGYYSYQWGVGYTKPIKKPVRPVY